MLSLSITWADARQHLGVAQCWFLVNSSLLHKSFADKTKIWVTALKIDSAFGKLLKQALLASEKAMSTQPHRDTPKKHSILPQRPCQFSTLA